MRIISIATLALIATVLAVPVRQIGTVESALVSLERREPTQDSGTQNIQDLDQGTSIFEHTEEYARMASMIFDDEEIEVTAPGKSMKLEDDPSSSKGAAVLTEGDFETRVAAVFADTEGLQKGWSKWRSEFMDRKNKRITDADAGRLTEFHEIIRKKILPEFDALAKGQKAGERVLTLEKLQKSLESIRNALALTLLDHYSMRAASGADLDLTKCVNMSGCPKTL
ncbi:hypothetical protein FRB95_011259 [Tulasnella sp. JGI-2019a]|nr:hypothetical protein FRB95_011259 [Tulasnella sp. JGI-2019a]